MGAQRRVALVTGAAYGIGAGIADRLAADGYDLALTAETDVPEAVGGTPAGRVARRVADLRIAATADELVAWALAEFGRLDLLVNNAGRTLSRSLIDTTSAEFDDLYALNLRAPWALVRAAVPALRAGRGVVVTVGSLHGSLGMPGHSAYAATKGALVSLTRELAVELAPEVRVCCVLPGFIHVPRYDDDPWFAAHGGAGLAPAGDVGKPADVAAAVSYLASDDARYVTGSCLTVDGGVSAVMPTGWGAD